jgi:uncharacterized RDD family membrane protein YckC
MTGRARRDVVTPYAFQVHPALLGLPLAQPWRRALAITIDGVVVALLSQVPTPLLALVAGGVMFRWTGQTRHPTAVRWRSALRAFAVALFLLGAAGFLIGRNSSSDGVPTAGAPPPAGAPAARTRIELQLGAADFGIGLGWAAVYFSVFPAWWIGQTPGKRLLGIRVVQLDGTPISLWEAFERYGGYGAGLATGLLGFVQVFWDANRQAIHDKIAETVVIRGSLPATGTEG